MQRALEAFRQLKFPTIPFAFDGKKNFYTAKQLPSREMEAEVEIPDLLRNGTKKFKIVVKWAADIDMRVLKIYNRPGFQNLDKPSQPLQCLDIVLRTIFRTDANATVAGRSIYYRPDRPEDLGMGMELW